jgi:hypothetical protein
MSIKTAILCTVFAAGASLSMGASARVYVDVDVAPPAPQEEVIPEPRVGFVWAPGYWNWEGHRHVWVGGHYIHERAGHHWVPAGWEERHGKYHFNEGHWD